MHSSLNVNTKMHLFVNQRGLSLGADVCLLCFVPGGGGGHSLIWAIRGRACAAG